MTDHETPSNSNSTSNVTSPEFLTSIYRKYEFTGTKATGIQFIILAGGIIHLLLLLWNYNYPSVEGNLLQLITSVTFLILIISTMIRRKKYTVLSIEGENLIYHEKQELNVNMLQDVIIKSDTYVQLLLHNGTKLRVHVTNPSKAEHNRLFKDRMEDLKAQVRYLQKPEKREDPKIMDRGI